MAILATERNRKILAEEMRQQAHKEEKVRNEAQEKANIINGLKLRVPAKASETGKIYGSVNNVQIANAIKEACNLDIDRKQIVLSDDTVKEIGSYKAKVKLHKDVQAEVEFEVYAE